MEDQEDMLSQIVRAIQEELEERLVAVVLFGSRARGQVTGTWEALHRVLARYAGHRLAAVYEAGYFGFRLHDRLADLASPVWLLLRVWSPRNMATGSKPIGGTVVNNLKSYAFDKKLRPEDNLFKINRTRAWKIIKAAARRRIPFPASPTFFYAESHRRILGRQKLFL